MKQFMDLINVQSTEVVCSHFHCNCIDFAQARFWDKLQKFVISHGMFAHATQARLGLWIFVLHAQWVG